MGTYRIPSGTKTPFVTPGMTSDLVDAYGALSAIGGVDVGNMSYNIDTGGGSDASAALATAIEGLPAGGGRVRLRGTILLQAGRIPFVPGLELVGDEWLATKIIYQGSGASPYCFDLDPVGTNTSAHLEDILIKGVNITATGGTIFGGTNMVRSVFERCWFQAGSNGYGIIDTTTGGNATQAGGLGHAVAYMAECAFLGNKEYDNRAAPTTPLWNLDHSGAVSFAGNDNRWDYGGGKVWASIGGNTAMPWLRLYGSQAGTTGSRNGKISKLVMEYPRAGMIDLRNTTGWTLEDITLEDLASFTMGTNPMINLGSIPGDTEGCEGCSIVRYRRRSGAAMYNGTSGPYDIQLDSHCSNITIDSPDHQAGGSLVSVQTNGAHWVRQVGEWPPEGAYYLGQPASVSISNGSTITPTGYRTHVTCSGAVTGVILAPGAYDGQEVVLLNKGGTGQNITFAAGSTSNVADGASDVLSGNSAGRYIWSVSSTKWFRE